MRKLTRGQIIKLTNKLKPFWKKRQSLYSKFFNEERKIEYEMNKNLKSKIKLEFFYCDGECVGIGAEDYSERQFFPLIHDSELDN